MKIKSLQQGGPVQQQGGGPEEQLMQMAQQIIEQLGPEGAMMLAQMIAQMLQESSGEGAQPQQPTYQRKGGKLVKISR